MEDAKGLWNTLFKIMRLDKIKEAVMFIEDNFSELLKDDPLKLLNIHIDQLIILKEFEKAFRALDKYAELPYISYEFEEMLREKRSKLYASMKKEINKLPVESINQLLSSKDEGKIMQALHIIDEKKIADEYLDSLRPLLINENIAGTMKSLILIMLVEQKVMQSVVVKKNDIEYILVPYELDPIVPQLEIEQLMQQLGPIKNVSVYRACKDILIAYALYAYPDSIIDGDDMTLLTLIACLSIAVDMYHDDVRIIDDLLKYHRLSGDKLNILKVFIKDHVLNQK